MDTEDLMIVRSLRDAHRKHSAKEPNYWGRPDVQDGARNQLTRELDVSVCWLKPSRKQLGNIKKFKESLKQGNPRVTYHIGCYSSIHSEKSANALLAYKIEKL